AGHISERLVVRARDEQRVPLEQRPCIEERDRVGLVHHHVRGPFPLDDLAEHAPRRFTHAHILTPRHTPPPIAVPPIAAPPGSTASSFRSQAAWRASHVRSRGSSAREQKYTRPGSPQYQPRRSSES